MVYSPQKTEPVREVIMTNIKRNDPCPCGSGKKYKKCCLPKDKAAAKARQSIQSAVVPPTPILPEAPALPETPPDPHTEALNALWDAFQAADYEAQIALFETTLAETPDLMDHEMAFEFLNTIYDESVSRDERDRFEALADALQAQLPEVYARESGYILGWRITNALAQGRDETVPALTLALAEQAEDRIDEFFNVLDELAYHNQLEALIPAGRMAWPKIKNSLKVWGADELAAIAVDHLIFQYLSSTSTPTSNDPDLLEAIAFYMELDMDRFTDFVSKLSTPGQTSWTMADFDFGPPPSPPSYGDEDEEETDEREGRQQLVTLLFEFLGYLYHTEQVPYAKGELARPRLYEYLLRRHDGDFRTSQPKRITKPKKRRAPHPLCPDRQTLDQFLGEMLGFINPQFYKAAATLELIPAWLRFLESRHLIDAHVREQTLTNLQDLPAAMGRALADFPDPALRQAMERWPQ